MTNKFECCEAIVKCLLNAYTSFIYCVSLWIFCVFIHAEKYPQNLHKIYTLIGYIVAIGDGNNKFIGLEAEYDW